MKKILLTLALLLMASAAFAECALYVEDFELSQSELGTEIVVPVKAHFSARLNAWQVDLSLPQGLTAVDATAGEDQVVTYRDSQGNEREKAPYFYGLGSNNRYLLTGGTGKTPMVKTLKPGYLMARSNGKPVTMTR